MNKNRVKINKLKEKSSLAAKKPGVYFWLGKSQEVLYIGRAVNLRNRLKQYWQKNIDPRIKEMVDKAVDIKLEETESLLEAIILEASYIKKYWPKYNVRDRDDRSFLYLIIGRGSFAKPIIIRGSELKKINIKEVDIFGPYQSRVILQNILRLIRRVFPYSNCKVNSGKACFDYQIGLCPGACISKITELEYKKNIEGIKLLLSGKKKNLFKKLSKENPEKIKSLKYLQDVSLLSREEDLSYKKLFRIEAYDISHHSGKESYGSMIVWENGQENKNEYRLFKIKEAPERDDERALLEVLSRRLKHKEWPLADLFLIDGGSPQINFLSKEFSKKNINLPLVGISKLAGDKLVFPSKTKKEWQELIENLKPLLLRARDEAHRFANCARQRSFRKKDLVK